MKKLVIIVVALLLIISLSSCRSNADDNKQDRVLPYRIIDKKEAIEYYLSNGDYFSNYSEYDIEYRTQSKDGTVDSLKGYGANQMCDFTDEEKDAINSAMDEIEMILKDNEYRLPKTDEIVFVKSTQDEEGGAVAYTHGTQIYMNNILPLYLRTNKQNHQKGLSILAHEIFHCLTRNNSEFRKDMYGLINFNIADNDFEIPNDIKRMIISNPDVEHHDAYATFTINGIKKDYYLLNICTQPFEKKGDLYTDHYEIILVPTIKEDSDKDFYFLDESQDYWNIFGENTKYITDPEECLADNFGYTLVYGLDGPMKYKNPEIIQAIIDLLKSGKYK